MTYVVSDIHGEYELFLGLLEKINFTPCDTIYICGDIIDKGNNSIKLLQYISDMPNAKCIIGNHEYAFLKYYWALMRECNDDFESVLQRLNAYFGGENEKLTWEIIDWLEALPFYIEEKDFICVHAGVPLNENGNILPLEIAMPEELLYDRKFKEPSVLPKGEKCVFFGHTPTCYITNENKILTYCKEGKKGDKVSDYHKVHLDMGTWITGMIGAFCIESCETIYVK